MIIFSACPISFPPGSRLRRRVALSANAVVRRFSTATSKPPLSFFKPNEEEENVRLAYFFFFFFFEADPLRNMETGPTPFHPIANDGARLNDRSASLPFFFGCDNQADYDGIPFPFSPPFATPRNRIVDAFLFLRSTKQAPPIPFLHLKSHLPI